MKKFIDLITALFLLPSRTKISQVLDLINLARTSIGLPELATLPDGEEGRSTACPLAHSLGGMVGVDGICFKESYKARYVAEAWNTRVSNRGQQRFVVDLPVPLRKFVRDFDLGAYRLFA